MRPWTLETVGRFEVRALFPDEHLEEGERVERDVRCREHGVVHDHQPGSVEPHVRGFDHLQITSVHVADEPHARPVAVRILFEDVDLAHAGEGDVEPSLPRECEPVRVGVLVPDENLLEGLRRRVVDREAVELARLRELTFRNRGTSAVREVHPLPVLGRPDAVRTELLRARDLNPRIRKPDLRIATTSRHLPDDPLQRVGDEHVTVLEEGVVVRERRDVERVHHRERRRVRLLRPAVGAVAREAQHPELSGERVEPALPVHLQPREAVRRRKELPLHHDPIGEVAVTPVEDQDLALAETFRIEPRLRRDVDPAAVDLHVLGVPRGLGHGREDLAITHLRRTRHSEGREEHEHHENERMHLEPPMYVVSADAY